MLVGGRGRAAYVDPFDHICHGLGPRGPATTDSKEALSILPDHHMSRKHTRTIGKKPKAVSKGSDPRENIGCEPGTDRHQISVGFLLDRQQIAVRMAREPHQDHENSM